MESANLKGAKRATGRMQLGVSLLEMTISMTLGAVILVSLFSLYYVAAASAAKEESRAATTEQGRLLIMKLVREIRLMGLFATEDIDADSNDIDSDVPSMMFTNGSHEAIEFASTNTLVFSCDVENDSTTETLMMTRVTDGVEPAQGGTGMIRQERWVWDRDSVQWVHVGNRFIGDNVEAMIFRYYDSDGNELPGTGPMPVGGWTLTAGERMRITAIEVSLVVRENEEDNGRTRHYVYLPDGQYWYDHFSRKIYRVMVRGRNLNLES